MNTDLSRLRIEKIIVHDVPKRLAGGGGEPMQLSEVESPLNQGLINFFRERVTTSLDSGAYRVVFDAESGSPVPGLVLDVLGERRTDFVGMSREVATHLHASQTGVNPSGLLIVMQASLAEIRSLAILKLEREMGVRARPYQQDGKATFDIEQIQDLMLTERTRVFKVGLFVQQGDTLDSIRGDVTDKQRGLRPKTEVAEYFLKTFLGCRLHEVPETTTKRFFETTQTFINERVDDGATKTRYELALLVTLANQEGVVRPKAFAEAHLDLEDRNRYVSSLAEAQVPTGEFEKDTSRIAGQLKKIRLDFESDIVVLVSPEVVEDGDLVEIGDLGDGRTRVVIEDRLRSLRGK